MKNKYEVFMGIEIHLELNTKTKFFSPALNSFALKPNTSVHPIDLGYPGTLPRVNKNVVIKGIKLAKALKMEIDNCLRFDRKNYFYVDLPKGYQITQDNYPLGKNGILPIYLNKKFINIPIQRIHLEEDTAKSIHENQKTFLDFNRAGIPLIEIVTDPVFHSSEEVVKYIENIQNLVLTLDISNAKMAEGSLRIDLNISLKPYGQKKYNNKVEIKNLNSLNNLKKAIQNEIVEQSQALDNNQVILQVTKRFDEKTQKNVFMRIKTKNLDYKFFPEPNINPIFLENDFIENIKIPELPWEKRKRYLNLKLKDNYIEQLISDVDKASYFDGINFQDKQKVATIFFSEIAFLLNVNNISISQLNIESQEISKILQAWSNNEISHKQIKIIIPKMHDEKLKFQQIVKKYNFAKITNQEILKKIIYNVIKSYLSFFQKETRKEKLFRFLMGNVMKETQGQADPIIAKKLINEVLEKGKDVF